MDVIKRYPEIERLLKYYDHMFTMITDDVNYLRRFNLRLIICHCIDSKNFFKLRILRKMGFKFYWNMVKNRGFLIKVSKLLERI